MLAPSRKEESGYRDYAAEDVNRLKMILLYRKMGLPIGTIYLVFQGSVSLKVALERQTEELVKQKEEIIASLELLCRERVRKHGVFIYIDSNAYYDWTLSRNKKCDNRKCNEHFITLDFFVAIK